ncbi:MAG: Uma2 family endonuclease [Pirellulales bacterium]|nr:Uma2 family endonuclease [Pirellulales bacterium]
MAFAENRLIEFTNGCIEVLPMPMSAHQLIVRFLLDALRSFVEPGLGVVLFAPLPLSTVPTKYREPISSSTLPRTTFVARRSIMKALIW